VVHSFAKLSTRHLRQGGRPEFPRHCLCFPLVVLFLPTSRFVEVATTQVNQTSKRLVDLSLLPVVLMILPTQYSCFTYDTHSCFNRGGRTATSARNLLGMRFRKILLNCTGPPHLLSLCASMIEVERYSGDLEVPIRTKRMQIYCFANFRSSSSLTIFVKRLVKILFLLQP
jgi:hypothetical protein